MAALELIMQNYKGTEIIAPQTCGFGRLAEQLDCNCVDCGGESDCGVQEGDCN